MGKPKQIGILTKEIIDILNLSLTHEADIFIGDSNITHIKRKHMNAYIKYGKYIKDILKEPDFVGLNKKDNSIEYVKEFVIDNREYVKVAIRVSITNKLFVRTLYILNNNRVQNFIKKNTLKPLTK